VGRRCPSVGVAGHGQRLSRQLRLSDSRCCGARMVLLVTCWQKDCDSEIAAR